MSTKSKLIVACAIVVAIAGLITLDLVLFQKGRRAETGSSDTVKVISGDNLPKDGTTMKEGGTKDLTQPKDDMKNVTPKTDEIKKDSTMTKKDDGTEFLPLDKEFKEPFSEVYEVQSGDSYWKIAQKKYGNGGMYEVIQKANPEVKSLKPGMKIAIPSKPESSDRKGLKEKEKILNDKEFVSGNEYQVKSGDSLWKIAAKLSNGKGIYSLMDKIVAANSDKLKNTSTMLKVGWKLTIPN